MQRGTLRRENNGLGSLLGLTNASYVAIARGLLRVTTSAETTVNAVNHSSVFRENWGRCIGLSVIFSEPEFRFAFLYLDDEQVIKSLVAQHVGDLVGAAQAFCVPGGRFVFTSPSVLFKAHTSEERGRDQHGH